MPRFLVVDDEPSHVSALTRLLEMDGHQVSAFTEAVDAVRALSSERFDGVLTDLEMPITDGHAVIRAARAQQPHACLVVVTVRPETELTRLVDAGACVVSDKPLDYEGLVQALTTCRARFGPGAHGNCHIKDSGGPRLLSLVRR